MTTTRVLKIKQKFHISPEIYVILIFSVNFSMTKMLMKKYEHSFKASLVRKELYSAILRRTLTLIS